MTVPKCIIDMLETRRILRTTEVQIVPKLKNNEPRPNFTSSYKKKAFIGEQDFGKNLRQKHHLLPW